MFYFHHLPNCMEMLLKTKTTWVQTKISCLLKLRPLKQSLSHFDPGLLQACACGRVPRCADRCRDPEVQLKPCGHLRSLRNWDTVVVDDAIGFFCEILYGFTYYDHGWLLIVVTLWYIMHLWLMIVVDFFSGEFLLIYHGHGWGWLCCRIFHGAMVLSDFVSCQHDCGILGWPLISLIWNVHAYSFP